MAGLIRVEGTLLANEHVACGRLIVDLDALRCVQHLCILLIAHEEVLEKILIHVLSSAILRNQEEARVGDSLRRRQEFAFLLNILSICDAWRARLLIVDTLNHLIKIERD